MQTDTRLVQNVEHIDQLRAHLSRQSNTLALTARQRTRRTRQRQIAQSDIDQKARTRAHLLQYFVSDSTLFISQFIFDLLGPLGKFRYAQIAHLGDIFASHAEVQRLTAQTRATTNATLLPYQELLAPLISTTRIVIVQAVDILGNALPRDHLVTQRRATIDRHRLRIAIQHHIHRLLRERRNRIVQREIVTTSQRFERRKECICARLTQRLDTALADRSIGIGHNTFEIENRLITQTITMRTSSLRRVKREGMRCGIVECQARRRTHQMAAIKTRSVCIIIIYSHRTLALTHCLFEARNQTIVRRSAHNQSIDNQINMVNLVAVELHTCRDIGNLAIDSSIQIALLLKLLEQLTIVTLATLHNGS